MAEQRTKEQLLDQLVFAVAAVIWYYGPALNEEGLKDLRIKLSSINIWCDSTWRCDIEESPCPDYCPAVISNIIDGETFEEVVTQSK